MADEAEWQRLCDLLDDDPELWSAVRDAGAGADAWDALLSGLDDAGALAYLEPSDTGMELADALAQLPRVFRTRPDLDAANDTDELAEAMRLADLALSEVELRLVRLEEPDSDALALVAVRAEAVPALLGLAARLGVPLAALS